MPRFATPKPRAPAAPPEQPYDRNFWKQFSRKQIAKGLEAFDESDRVSLHEDWLLCARDEQLPPPGDWRIWLFMGGRGAGKTRSGAEWIAEGVDDGTMLHIGLVGATHNDARSVMIEGVSGLLRSAPGATYEPTNRRVKFANGAQATVLSADEPDTIRGHQFDTLWLDEIDLLKLQMQAKAAETESEIKVAQSQGSWGGLTSSVTAEGAIGASYPWVNAIRALVRPTLTIGLTTFLATAFFAMAPGDIDRAYVADSLVFVAVTSVVWWFGDRAPKKLPHP